MKSIVTSLIVKLLDVDTICTLVAKAIARILQYASKKGGSAWDVAKKVVTKVNLWTSLFLQVYDDEELTPEEERKIADAIRRETSVEKLVDILRKDGAEGEKKAVE